MTTEQKIIRNKMSLLELAEYLKNVSEACRVMGVSRQHFYDIKTAYHEQGLEGLKDEEPQEALHQESRGSGGRRGGGDPCLGVSGLWSGPSSQ